MRKPKPAKKPSPQPQPQPLTTRELEQVTGGSYTDDADGDGKA